LPRTKHYYTLLKETAEWASSLLEIGNLEKKEKNLEQ